MQPMNRMDAQGLANEINAMPNRSAFVQRSGYHRANWNVFVWTPTADEPFKFSTRSEWETSLVNPNRCVIAGRR